jgi:hypothetical protein
MANSKFVSALSIMLLSSFEKSSIDITPVAKRRVDKVINHHKITYLAYYGDEN